MEDGRCEMLMDNGMCQVYDARPTICRVDKMYDQVHSGQFSKQEYYEMTANLCNKWMTEVGLPQEMFVKLN